MDLEESDASCQFEVFLGLHRDDGVLNAEPAFLEIVRKVRALVHDVAHPGPAIDGLGPEGGIGSQPFREVADIETTTALDQYAWCCPAQQTHGLVGSDRPHTV